MYQIKERLLFLADSMKYEDLLFFASLMSPESILKRFLTFENVIFPCSMIKKVAQGSQ